MAFEIVFCTDGILRIRHGDKTPMVPAYFVHKNDAHSSDFSFWNRWWDERVVFEDGLTVAKFLSCLEPWAQFFKELTHKDIQAFIDESRLPTIVDTSSKNKDSHPLTWIGLFYQTSLSPDLEFEGSEEEDFSDLESWLNKKKRARLSGIWEISSSYKLSGYCEGYDEHYGVDHTPMNDIANLPLYLSPIHFLSIEESMAERVVGSPASMLNPHGFGIQRFKTPQGTTLKYLEGVKEHRFRDIIEGFFWWFPADPIKREEFYAQLEGAIEGMRESTLLDDNTENASTIKNNIHTFPKEKKVKNRPQEAKQAVPTENSNVVPLFAQETKVATPEKEQPSITSVSIAPNAFSNIAQHYRSQQDYWENTLQAAQRDKDALLKIGKLNIGEPKERRLYAYIVPKDIQPSEYKDL